MKLRKKRNIVRKKALGRGLINSLINSLPVELHIPGYQYCGPGTKLHQRLERGDPGINPLDRYCRSHDIAYALYPDLERRQRADQELLRGADERINSADADYKEKAAAYLIKSIMTAKTMMGAGLKRKKRGKKGAGCRKKKCVKKGGFLLPLITGSLAAFNSISKYKNAQKMLEEQKKHNKAMQEIAKGGKGLFLKPYGTGLKKKKKIFLKKGQQRIYR